MPEIYQIKITLRGSKPPIWRRVLAPADLTLERLHLIVQAAMGWYDCHLHEFGIDKQRFGMPDPDSFGGPPIRGERGIRLSKALPVPMAKALYTYDFGDDWIHTIVVEKVLEADPERANPVCIAGDRACPPEDCGGVNGFYQLLETLGDPAHESHEEMLEWCGPFDAAAFSTRRRFRWTRLINNRLRPRELKAKR